MFGTAPPFWEMAECPRITESPTTQPWKLPDQQIIATKNLSLQNDNILFIVFPFNLFHPQFNTGNQRRLVACRQQQQNRVCLMQGPLPGDVTAIERELSLRLMCRCWCWCCGGCSMKHITVWRNRCDATVPNEAGKGQREGRNMGNRQ